MLESELEERERNAIARRIQEAHFPKVKTLEEFEFEKAPHMPATLIRNLAEGGYLKRSEPVLFLGEAGTGKPIWQRGWQLQPAGKESGSGLPRRRVL